MEFQRVVERRRMVRNFEDRPVSEAAVERILGNAIRAPSAGFSQGWGFLVLTDPEDRARFWEVAWPDDERTGSPHEGVMRAGLVVVPCANKQAYLDRYAEPDKGWTDRDERHWPVPYWLVDTSFATMAMLLTITDEGLGALFFSLRHGDAVKDAFGIPPEIEPIGALAAGYPARDEPSPSLARGRRPGSEVIRRRRW
ncbi:MAG TPA: nitroreductase family protein [Actinomycetota bacterium]|nr:nitroreductase family protein [Actinomycetota bacterium]